VLVGDPYPDNACTLPQIRKEILESTASYKRRKSTVKQARRWPCGRTPLSN
jgi:hypothetical protein